MALSLSSLDIINPQYSNAFLLEENIIPEIFNLYHDEAHPPPNVSFRADDYQSFGSSGISLDQINQILSPSYNSSHEKVSECDSWVNTLDQNYYHVNNQYGNNSMINGEIGENMYVEDSQYMLSYPMTSHIDYVQQSLKQERVSQKRKFEVLFFF